MTSDLEGAVVGEAWPYPEVSVHTCYIYTPGHHWPPSPKKKGLHKRCCVQIRLQAWVLDSKQYEFHTHTQKNSVVAISPHKRAIF